MAISITSLMHPTMIAKIREGIRLAKAGQGHLMNGHGQRVYIQNAQGRNIMRLNWLGDNRFIVWGDESKDITQMVWMALHRDLARSVDNVLSFDQAPALDDNFEGWDKPKKSTLYKGAGLVAVALVLTGCQTSGAFTTIFNLLTGWIS